MGNLEQINRRRVRRTRLQQAILATIKISGLLAIGLVAPNVISSMYKLGIITNKREGEIVRSAASRLKNKGLLIVEKGYYSLTSVGEKVLSRWQMADYKIPRPKKWDKKWRVIIFDIPEKKKVKRDQVRQIFIEAGFKRIQDSVWVYPFDCEDIIGLLKTDLGIGRDMLYMIVDQIENDQHLRQEFDLL